MFNNIGRKIKTLAEVVCWIGIITSVITAACLITSGERSKTLIGILIIIIGPIVSWLGSFMTYGFGQLVENSDILVATQLPTEDHPESAYTNQAGNSAPSYTDGWQCTCGRTHPRYETACVCGKSKFDY